jgi:hypothetical protein
MVYPRPIPGWDKPAEQVFVSQLEDYGWFEKDSIKALFRWINMSSDSASKDPAGFFVTVLKLREVYISMINTFTPLFIEAFKGRVAELAATDTRVKNAKIAFAAARLEVQEATRVQASLDMSRAAMATFADTYSIDV